MIKDNKNCDECLKKLEWRKDCEIRAIELQATDMVQEIKKKLKKEIADLEAKLAEKDTKLHEYVKCALEDYNDNLKDIIELKKQIILQEKQVREEVCQQIKNNCWCGGALLEDNYYKVPVKFLDQIQGGRNEMNNIKILDVQWFTCIPKCIGIVTIDNGFEIKTYFKPVLGFNEDYDIKDIIENGIKIYPSQLERILSFYKNKEKQ